MTPCSVTEKLYFFIAKYVPEMKVSEGGGVAGEEENIEVLEMKYEEAMDLIDSGEIQDVKTIMLLQYLRVHGIL
jgi:hypothetical protein